MIPSEDTNKGDALILSYLTVQLAPLGRNCKAATGGSAMAAFRGYSKRLSVRSMVLPEAHIGIYDGWALRMLCDTRNISSMGTTAHYTSDRNITLDTLPRISFYIFFIYLTY